MYASENLANMLTNVVIGSKFKHCLELRNIVPRLVSHENLNETTGILILSEGTYVVIVKIGDSVILVFEL